MTEKTTEGETSRTLFDLLDDVTVYVFKSPDRRTSALLVLGYAMGLVLKENWSPKELAPMFAWTRER